jgi:hypothetical protein
MAVVGVLLGHRCEGYDGRDVRGRPAMIERGRPLIPTASR